MKKEEEKNDVGVGGGGERGKCGTSVESVRWGWGGQCKAEEEEEVSEGLMKEEVYGG